MIWEKFKDNFHESWWEKIKPFIESEECDNIYAFLKQRSREGVKITPSSICTYRAFKETPLDSVKVVVLGYSPYHTVVNGRFSADGLAFSCSITNILQPSLDLWWDAMEEEFYGGLYTGLVKNPDLTFLANQGVLLLNSSLTTEVGTPGKHQDLWMSFTKYVISDILNDRSLPFVVIGKDAQLFTPLIKGSEVYEIEHPAYAARQKRKWKTEKVFSKINYKLGENYINWFTPRVEDEEAPF